MGDRGVHPCYNPQNPGLPIPSDLTLGPDGTPGERVPLVLPDRYVDLGLLAGGGFAEVRRVEDRVLGAPVAMKLLRADSDSAAARRRFVHEAKLMARLRHPGIVAVHDLGTLPDGRPWYTMEEVRGETLGDVLRALHGGDARWSLRRVVEALTSAAQAVAAAHHAGVVHRDLKPDNVMVGAFGEVRVMDWGIARDLRTADEPGTDAAVDPSPHTQAGLILGTPTWMPPEQARGDLDALGPPADVYALGAMLYATLAGRPPYEGGGRAAWLAVLAGPPPDVRTVGPRVPAELAELCARAMARDPADRPLHAGALADALLAWLDGDRRTAEALAVVDTVRVRLPTIHHLREASAALAAQSRAALAGVASHAPAEAKLHGWRLESEAQARRAEARRLEAELVRDLRAALTSAPELPEAHAILADLHRDRLIDAEARGDADAALDAELSLRDHDRGRHRRWLDGIGAVTLVTDPPGAQVDLYRVEEQDRHLVEVPAGSLGVTPLVEVPLPRGAYVLVLRAPGRVPVRYPVTVGRLEHWDGVRLGDGAPYPIVLPEHLDPEDCYVPAGWFLSGGDERAIDVLPARRRWVDAFVIRRFPVTVADYRAFLDDGGAAWVPRSLEGAPFFVPDADGRHAWGAIPRLGQNLSRDDEPVAFVTAFAADAFAAWTARRTGRPWRLPHDQEWEKAARGVDGRPWPWGHHLDPSDTCMQLSHAGVPARAPIDSHPRDRSVYDVRGLGGNVRAWCENAYARVPDEPVVVPRAPAPADAAYRCVRGGSLVSTGDTCRSAGRFASPPSTVSASVGIRLVHSW